MIIYTPTNKRPLDIQFKAINAVYKLFEKEYIEKIHLLNTYGVKHKNEKLLYLRYQRFKRNFKNVLHVLKFCLENNCTINRYYIKNTKTSPISKRHFYREKLKLCKLCDKRSIDFEYHLPKTPIPKKIKYKYNHLQRMRICDYFYTKITDTNNMVNKTNLWIRIKQLDLEYKNMSYTTLVKILQQDNRFELKPNSSIARKHLFRRTIKELGIIQLDLKIFGLKETKVNKKVAVFNAIDIATRLVFSKVLSTQTNIELIQCMNEMELFFREMNIKIKRIQTDNAMQFKNTNFVKSNIFNNWCNERNIIHTFIPYQQPECNGCIERYHRTIDCEIGKLLNSCATIEMVEWVFKKWVPYYNNDRLLHYTELDEISKENKYMTPINSINFFMTYNLSV